jgi:molybdenum cofactor cytidylyltransferase
VGASQPLRSGLSPAAVVLAAGAGTRYSSEPGGKLLAPVDGRPLLARVLDTLREYRPSATVVVLGHGADAIEAALEWSDEILVRNTAPERGIASSLAVGFEALMRSAADAESTFVVLGDQPALRVSALKALEAAAARPGAAALPLIVPRYRDDPGPRNPVLVRRSAWPLVADLQGDRGLASVIVEHPDLCLQVAVAGAMPDIDTPEDLVEPRQVSSP